MSIKPDKIKELVGYTSEENRESTGTQKKVLMIVANSAVSEQTGWAIGYWAVELTHVFLEFGEAGCEVLLASPDGGKVEMDAYSDPRATAKFRWACSPISNRSFGNINQ